MHKHSGGGGGGSTRRRRVEESEGNKKKYFFKLDFLRFMRKQSCYAIFPFFLIANQNVTRTLRQNCPSSSYRRIMKRKLSRILLEFFNQPRRYVSKRKFILLSKWFAKLLATCFILLSFFLETKENYRYKQVVVLRYRNRFSICSLIKTNCIHSVIACQILTVRMYMDARIVRELFFRVFLERDI